MAIRPAEFLATGSRSTRWFQGLSAGNTGQAKAPGSGRADPSDGSTIAAASAIDVRHAEVIAARRKVQDTTAIPPGATLNPASLTSPM